MFCFRHEDSDSDSEMELSQKGAILAEQVKSMIQNQKRPPTTVPSKESKKFTVDGKKHPKNIACQPSSKLNQIPQALDPLATSQFKASNINSGHNFVSQSPPNSVTPVPGSYSTLGNLFACSNSPSQPGTKVEFVPSTTFRPLIANPYNSAAAAVYLQQSFNKNC